MILTLKKVFVISVVTVLLGALSVYAVSLLISGGAAPSITSTKTIGPLELKLELEKTEFEQGEPVNVTVSLKNTENTTIKITFSYTGVKVGFDVLHANDTLAHRGPIAILAGNEDVYLAPNEELRGTYTWDQTIELRVDRTVYGELKAPQGTYKIVGRTSRPILVQGIWPLGTPETPPITITIK